ncbi:MinD/ParA family ATP-binding protein [Micromonospora reichwaldensis]|uniref:MinD/ParA family ATP-binding protein n=1 Tax=Micromonospora reichwaldensis TaxID=3075516 RepID=UPI0037C74710
MALGGRAVEGSETGWGRPAEPAPRWRALLDRARHGSRTAEQAEADRHADPPPLPPEPLPRRSSGNGYAARVPAIGRAPEPYVPEPGPPPYGADAPPPYGAEYGRPVDAGYRAEATYRVEPAYRVDPLEPAYRVEPEHPPEPTYRSDPVEPTYRSDPVEPSYRSDPVEPTYRSDPVEPTYRSGSIEPAYRVDPIEPTYRADPGYPAEPAYRVPAQPPPPRIETEPRRGPGPVESRYAVLDNGYRHESPPVESRYAVLDNGYRSRRAHQAPPAAPPPVVPPPAVPPPAAPPLAVPPPAVPPLAVPPPVERGYPARVEWRPRGAEDEVERAVGVLRRDLGTPRVLAFANPKGGVHKTTATVLAAATVGSVRGRGVLAWDDNELRGTLGLRAGSARHARTIRHLVGDLAHVEIKEGPELLAHLDDYLRHASDGSYDVLAGEESPRFAQRLDQFTVRRVLELLRRTHDVVCVDTGNNVESANWRTVMQAADQLVVTTVPREDAAFSADWMLDLLHEVGMGELADNAVTLISCPTPGRSPLQDDLERHFATRTRAVAVVPYDPALETGSSIEYHQLQQETRQAWLKAASVMLEPFAR